VCTSTNIRSRQRTETLWISKPVILTFPNGTAPRKTEADRGSAARPLRRDRLFNTRESYQSGVTLHDSAVPAGLVALLNLPSISCWATFNRPGHAGTFYDLCSRLRFGAENTCSIFLHQTVPEGRRKKKSQKSQKSWKLP
jgi:hypothetical protein